MCLHLANSDVFSQFCLSLILSECVLHFLTLLIGKSVYIEQLALPIIALHIWYFWQQQ